MTKENCIRLLKHYLFIKKTDAYNDMKEHILKSAKFTQEEKDELFKEPKGSKKLKG
tara:strand:- start:567 stop:734 length:168 start_codon:yes stop_codon:yes gene_type:complete